MDPRSRRTFDGTFMGGDSAFIPIWVWWALRDTIGVCPSPASMSVDPAALERADPSYRYQPGGTGGAASEAPRSAAPLILQRREGTAFGASSRAAE